MSPRGRRRGRTASRARSERGAALLLALLLVALVATLASAMVWQHWRAVQVEAAERARAQAAWILDGATDWVRLILREDRRSGSTDHLGEPWATPLAEARLSTFLAVDRDRSDESDVEAFLSGEISDAQARYNLRNLFDAQGQPMAAELAVLARLCAAAGVGPDVAVRIVRLLRASWHEGAGEGAGTGTGAGSGAGSASTSDARPLAVSDLMQLAWLGVDAAALRAACAEMQARLGGRIRGFIAQPMVRGVGEAILGYRRDKLVGPVVALGAGGVLAEVYRDVVLRAAPVDEATAMAMIAEVKGLAPARGYRGLPKGDLAALARAVAQFSRLAGLAEVSEAEINPLIVLREGEGVVMADALLARTG